MTPHVSRMAEVTAAAAGTAYLTGLFTSEWLITLGGVLVLVIGALSTFAVAVITALAKKQAEAAAAAVAAANLLVKKIDAVAVQASVITGHVNSAASASAAKIAALQATIVSLTAMLSKQDERAALLAQSVATNAAVELAAAPAPQDGPA